MTPESRLRAAARPLLTALPFLLAIYALVLNSSLGRPLWIDEFLHFALAAEPSTAEAWHVASQTFDNINHGQTGFYMMLNYWTLALTGANAMALRLPSLISGGLLFVSAIFMFRVLGFSVPWQIVVVLALMGQHMLMGFVGEARPYMPLAAASSGILAYYVGRAHRPDDRAVIVLGLISAAWGTLMHPYFALYWPVACVVGWLHRCSLAGEKLSVGELVRFANPPLVIAGAAVFFVVGWASWMKGRPTFSFDPFQWIQPAGLLANANFSHTQFLQSSYRLAAIFTLVALLGIFLLPARIKGGVNRLWAPLVLIAFSLLVSVTISWLSYRANYWILPRQWVASASLLALGTVWLWAEASRIWERVAGLLGVVGIIAAAAIVQRQAIHLHHLRMAELTQRLEASRSAGAALDCNPPESLDMVNLNNDERNARWVELANRNVGCGGPVWPVVGQYYAGIIRGRAAR